MKLSFFSSVLLLLSSSEAFARSIRAPAGEPRLLTRQSSGATNTSVSVINVDSYPDGTLNATAWALIVCLE